MKFFTRLLLVAGLACGFSLGATGCQEKKETKKVTVEGPEKKHEIKVETTEKK